MSGKKYLLDSCIIIDFFRGNEDVIQKLKNTANVFIPNIVLGELFYGAEISHHPKKNIKKLKGFFESFKIINSDDFTSEFYAKIKKQLKEQGTPLPENDMWIAAVARQYNLTLATLDKHFDKITGISVEYWD